MNALMTLKEVEADLDKRMQAFEEKTKLKEELLETLALGGTAGIVGSFIVTMPELCDMDSDYGFRDSVGNALIGFVVGAGAGLAYSEASKRFFVTRRAKALEASVAKLRKEVDNDYLVVKESFGNIFDSYADGHQIEREIYDFGFKLAQFEETKVSLIIKRDNAEAEIKRLSESIGTVFGHSDKTILNRLSDQKAEKVRVLEECAIKIKEGEAMLENKDKLINDLKTKYATTLANRMARDKFNKLFLEGLAKDATYLKGIFINNLFTAGSGKDLIRHQKTVAAIKVHHTILISAYKEIVKDLDDYRDKATSSLSRIRNNMKGKRGVDMTYSSAPFYKSFFIAKSFSKAKAKAEVGTLEILKGALEDFTDGKEQGTWINSQPYFEDELADCVFTKEDRSMLIAHLAVYFNEGVTSMDDFEEMNKAYKRFAKDKHSDTNGDNGSDELIAEVSTLMRKLRVHTKDKENLGGEN